MAAPRRRPGGPGRPSKGARDVFAVRPMQPVGDVIRANADALDMSYSDYISAILANALNMPEHAPTPPHAQDQLPLPLNRSA